MRSLHGEMSAFRIWNIETAGVDSCPSAATKGLIASYVFGATTGEKVFDMSGHGYNAMIHDATWSNELPPGQECTRQGFGGYFDGDQDWVKPPPLGAFPTLTVDTWVKFKELKGEHPIINEDGWNRGDMHLQIHSGKFDLSINGVGDFIFKWQPKTERWYFLSVQYSTGVGNKTGFIKLFVDNQFVEDNTMKVGAMLGPPGGAAFTNGLPNGGKACPCVINGPAVTLNSPRLGAWDRNHDGKMDRSMHGQIAVFRLWNIATDGMDSCPPTGTQHLIVNYLFDAVGSIMKDRSGNRKDAQMHDNKWSGDYPDLSCIYKETQLKKKQDAVPIGEHGQASLGCPTCKTNDPKTNKGATQTPVSIALTLAYTNPVVLAGIPTERGKDSTVVRVQNLRKYGERAINGLNAGGHQPLKPPDQCPADKHVLPDGTCNAAWCFELL